MNEKKVVLVTGASSGIGQVTAQLLAKKGCIIYGSARREAAFSSIQAMGCRPILLDVTDEESRMSAVNAILKQEGRIDVLVNNAGYGQMGPLEEMPMELIQQQFDTNVFGLLRMSQLVLPTMRKQGSGRIINISSVGGEMTFAGAGAYHMSKYAVESLNDALRYEVKSFGIKVISIQPGGVSTNFVDAGERHFAPAMPHSPYAVFRNHVQEGTRRMFVSGSSFGILTPEQVANTIAHAALSDRPRTRYKVGWLAKTMPVMRRWLGDRLWDRVVASQFPMQ